MSTAWEDDYYDLPHCIQDRRLVSEEPDVMPPGVSRLNDDSTTGDELDLKNTDESSEPITRLTQEKFAAWNRGPYPKIALKVRFLPGSGTQDMRDKVKLYAPIWSEYANITFQFVESGDADIRISFLEAEGFYSYVGKFTYPEPNWTMNLGYPIDRDIPDEHYQRSILHAFGHVLGFVHEHQSPLAHDNLKWLQVPTYRHFASYESGWSNLAIQQNVFMRYYWARNYATKGLDRQSIMTYTIPPDLTSNRYWMKSIDTLSTMDKQMAIAQYPSSENSCDTRLTKIVEPGTPLPSSIEQEVKFYEPDGSWQDQGTKPFQSVALGLSMIEYDGTGAFQCSAEIKNGSVGITPNGAHILMKHVGRVQATGYNYLWSRGFQPDTGDRRAFQTGVVRLEEASSSGSLEWSKTINFAKAWKANPTVIVWISGIAASGDSPLSITGSADGVGLGSFRLKISTSPNHATLEGKTQFTWVAYEGETFQSPPTSSHFGRRVGVITAGGGPDYVTELSLPFQTSSQDSLVAYEGSLAFSSIVTRSSISHGLNLRTMIGNMPRRKGQKLQIKVKQSGATSLKSFDVSYLARHWWFGPPPRADMAPEDIWTRTNGNTKKETQVN